MAWITESFVGREMVGGGGGREYEDTEKWGGQRYRAKECVSQSIHV